MRTKTRTDWHGKVEKAIGGIMQSLDKAIDFRKISQEVFSSPYHFHRKFRELTGESVHNCIRRLRLERAMYYLRNTNEAITNIAFDSGYETLESFLKAFKAAYGLKPSDARKFRNWDGLLYSKASLHYIEKNKSHWFYLSSKGDERVDTKIISFNKKRIVGVENIGDYWGLPKAWENFHQSLKQNNLYGVAKEWMSVFPDHDDAIHIEQKRSYAAIVVDDKFENIYGLKELIIPEGLYAVTVHFGSSEEIGPTWERWIKEWLPESGWEVDTTRPNYEWYQNQCVPPELLLTFLCTPVNKR
jgi:AraC family transcriptional regulator